ncbi:MAG: sigma-70 family RNA polymerase sigma factor [Chloroflexota bacterium]
MNQNTSREEERPVTASDETLVHQAKNGSLEAFRQLYGRYFPIIYNRVQYTVPDEDVEDITQEVFIAVIQSLRKFRGEAAFSTWIRSLTKHKIADYYRRKGRRNVSIYDNINEVNASDLKSKGQRIFSEVNRFEERILLRQALKKIPEHYREILLLRFAEGLRFHEISDLQGHSLEATKSLFRRAVALLRKEVNRNNV